MATYQKPFAIYRSSAGSGKTYTLAKSYLEIALKKDKGFRKILGVTFTNKATAEMKQRILQILRQLAHGTATPMAKELVESLNVSQEELQRRAKATLSDILHHYSRFTVVTIDSFFHQVIRSFAREIGLHGSFSIEMDTDNVMQMVIDQMLLDIGSPENTELKQWLIQFAEEKVDNGEAWDFRKDITTLSKELLKDSFKPYSEKIYELSKDPKFFKDFKKQLDDIKNAFEKQLTNICTEVFDYLDKNGISVNDFSSKLSGPVGLFNKFLKLDYEVTNPKREAIDNIDKWLTKANRNQQHLVSALEQFILPKYTALIHYHDAGIKHYRSAIEVRKYLNTFGILSAINGFLQRHRDERDIMLISDLPDFLFNIINDSDTPFIYEKVGATFDHYLIDEFQDTSTVQWNNFKPLVKNATDQGQFCMVVGDVKQSIYRFRGGDWQLLQKQVGKDIGTAEVVQEHVLDTNWRSTPEIVNFNNLFFEQMVGVIKGAYFDNAIADADTLDQQQFKDKLDYVLDAYADVTQKTPATGELKGEIFIRFIDEENLEEVKWKEEAVRLTIERVEALQEKGYQLRDIALLTRNKEEGKLMANAFFEHANSPLARPNMRYDVVSSEALYLTSSHLVKFILALIKWLNDEKNLIELAKWQYELNYYLKPTDQELNKLFGTVNNWQSNVSETFLKEKDSLKKMPLYELVEAICRLFELNKIEEEFAYLQGFQDAVLDYSKNERGDIISFLAWWERVGHKRAIQVAEENNAIKILTIHKSKGLEFPVVILPFIDWATDHNSTFENILWCSNTEAPPFNQLPILPLKYGKSLTQTYWAQEYFQEKLKALIDSLNLLYVAFTRPEFELIGFAPKPKIKKGATEKDLFIGNVHELLYVILTAQSGWQEDILTFSSGLALPQGHVPKNNHEFKLGRYHSGNWRSKIQLQIKGSAELNEAQFVAATARGILLHKLLSQIKSSEDLALFNEHEQYPLLKTIVEDKRIRPFFEKDWQVSCEVPILLPNGDFKRIDRLNEKAVETVIIDYKTGVKKEKDINQIKEYIELMSTMGRKQVSGILIYLDEMEVVVV